MQALITQANTVKSYFGMEQPTAVERRCVSVFYFIPFFFHFSTFFFVIQNDIRKNFLVPLKF